MCEKGKFTILGPCARYRSRYGNEIDADIYIWIWLRIAVDVDMALNIVNIWIKR